MNSLNYVSQVDGKPPTSEFLNEKAENFQFLITIPLKYWIRTADSLYKEGEVNLHDLNFEQAYFLFYRYSTLVLNNLGLHPDSQTAEGRKTVGALVKRLPAVIKQLEEIKPILDGAHAQWVRDNSRRERPRAGSTSSSAHRKNSVREPGPPELVAKETTVLDASQHSELAVDLAQREIRRRDAFRKASREAGLSAEQERERRVGGFWGDWEKRREFDRPPSDHGQTTTRRQPNDDDEFRNQMLAVRRRLDQESGNYTPTADEVDRFRDPPRSEYGSSEPPGQSASYYYPKISHSAPFDYKPSEVYRPKSRDLRESQPPALPPKPTYNHPPPIPARPPYPPRPARDAPREIDYPPPPGPPPKVKPLLDAPDRPAKRELDEDARAPFQRENKRVTFSTLGRLEDGTPLRPMFLPSNLRHEFVKLAAEHTRKGIEMCGILCGTLVNGALFIKTLLIPQQKCSSDTCETTNEEAVLEFCTTADVMILGWIHTHPTQTCFMSSRDVHTQAGYQVMMPESIAIVCAPKHSPTYGIFRLTNPPGLQHILECRDPSTFHQHDIDNVYTEAKHFPGHVCENDKLPWEIVDLRPK